jgi:hypothetical protein
MVACQEIKTIGDVEAELTRLRDLMRIVYATATSNERDFYEIRDGLLWLVGDIESDVDRIIAGNRKIEEKRAHEGLHIASGPASPGSLGPLARAEGPVRTSWPQPFLHVRKKRCRGRCARGDRGPPSSLHQLVGSRACGHPDDCGQRREDIPGLCRASLAAIRPQLVRAIAEDADRVLAAAKEEEAA